ncbi:MAG TPA: hypothetical protein VFH45_13475 [Acidimicrobiales bacterium]|nr:hypothetical protein [Acidimicrobiales bacterium]
MTPIGDDDLGARVERWAADLRAGERSRARRVARSLRDQAAGDASLASMLADLAEAGAEVSVSTRYGHQLRGRVTALGSDHIRLATATAEVIVSTAAVVTVEPATPWGRHPSDRPPPAGGPSLAAALEELAVDRARVTITLAGGQTRIGEIVRVGADYLELEVRPGAVAYLRLPAVEEVAARVSG